MLRQSLLGILLMAFLTLGALACSAAPTATSVPTSTPTPTATPTPTPEPTPTPTPTPTPRPTATPVPTPTPTFLEWAEATLADAVETIETSGVEELSEDVADLVCDVAAGVYAPALVLPPTLEGFVIQAAIQVLCGMFETPPALEAYDDNDNGRISCAEARRHGIAPVRRSDPAYEFMQDRDQDGIVCEGN